MRATLGAVLPRHLAMLALRGARALLGWIAGALVTRLARALRLDERSRTGVSPRPWRARHLPAAVPVLRLVAFWGIFVVFRPMGIDALPFPGPGATGVLMRFVLASCPRS